MNSGSFRLQIAPCILLSRRKFLPSSSLVSQLTGSRSRRARRDVSNYCHRVLGSPPLDAISPVSLPPWKEAGLMQGSEKGWKGNNLMSNQIDRKRRNASTSLRKFAQEGNKWLQNKSCRILAGEVLLHKRRMCHMPLIESKPGTLTLQKSEIRRPSPETSVSVKSAGFNLLGLGLTLAGAETEPMPGLCWRCRSRRNKHYSSSNFPNIFCSHECEQGFIHAALASVTLEDCIRIQRRLENLLALTERAPV
jgi:hypothetical protein